MEIQERLYCDDLHTSSGNAFCSIPSLTMNVTAAADYLTDRVNGRNNFFKIQKLLTFLECAYVAQTGDRLFKQDMVAWEHGLLYPEARDHLNRRGATGGRYDLGEQERQLLDCVIQEFECESADDMIGLSHQEPLWSNARRDQTLSEAVLVNLLYKHRLLGPGASRCERALLKVSQERSDLSESQKTKKMP